MTIDKIREYIRQAGGCSAFARKHKIPLRTVQNWFYGTAQPTKWAQALFDEVYHAKSRKQ